MTTTDLEQVFSQAFTSAHQRAQTAADFRLDYTLSCIEAHSHIVAQAAKTIATHARLDADLAYRAGLLHDIGKTDPAWTGLNHANLGYHFLLSLDQPTLARIALTHTWYGYTDIDRSEFWAEMSLADAAEVQEYLESHPFDDYDLLIQLVDNMAHNSGIMTISDRFCDILVRHNLKNAGAHLRHLYELKQYFDQKCGTNIYEFFRNSIIKTALQEPNDAAGIESESDYQSTN